MNEQKIVEILSIQRDLLNFLSYQLQLLKVLAPLEAEKLRNLLDELNERLKEI
jgi:hypothetical protein